MGSRIPTQEEVNELLYCGHDDAVEMFAQYPIEPELEELPDSVQGDYGRVFLIWHRIHNLLTVLSKEVFGTKLYKEENRTKKLTELPVEFAGTVVDIIKLMFMFNQTVDKRIKNNIKIVFIDEDEKYIKRMLDFVLDGAKILGELLDTFAEDGKTHKNLQNLKSEFLNTAELFILCLQKVMDNIPNVDVILNTKNELLTIDEVDRLLIPVFESPKDAAKYYNDIIDEDEEEEMLTQEKVSALLNAVSNDSPNANGTGV